MGLAYTVDTPIKVARFGISSVISIIEDRLVEMMRSHYYPTINKEYFPISTHEEDYRAKRITDYLNLVNIIGQVNRNLFLNNLTTGSYCGIVVRFADHALKIFCTSLSEKRAEYKI